MVLAGSDHLLAGPAEATAFLGAVAGFVTLLVVLFLYLSRKWCFTPVPNSAILGGICVPLYESTSSSTSPISKNLGESFTYPDPETSSDSEEDALRRLQNSCSTPPPDTLTIQAEDGPTVVSGKQKSSSNPPPDSLTIQTEDGPSVVDAGTTSSTTEEHCSDQLECVVDVGASTVHLENQEPSEAIEEHSPTSYDPVTPFSAAPWDLGFLEVALLYDAPMREMTVQVLEARNYPAASGGSQVRLVLLPSKKQRRKTRVRPGTSPRYMESFLLTRVNPEDVNTMGVRLRVYQWSGRMRRERLLGQSRISFGKINLQSETTVILPLMPPPSSSKQDWGTTTSLTRSDSTSSQQSVQSYASPTTPPYDSNMKGGSVPEILIGLSYNGTTGRLSVEINRGWQFRGGGGADTKPPDTYVKLALVDSNGHEMARSKTGVKRAQPNPLYMETFIYQVALFQLGDVTLFLSVCTRRRGAMGKKSREMIGWLGLGLNSSGPQEVRHWNDMRASPQSTQVNRWHSLLRP